VSPPTVPAVTPLSLLQMSQGARRAAILRAGLRLNVFDGLADGPLTPAEVSAALPAAERGVRILLNALAAIGVVRTDGIRYWLDESARILSRTSPDYFGDALMLTLSDFEWSALGGLAEAVQAGGTVLPENAESPGYGFWPELARNPTWHTYPLADKLAEVVKEWAKDRQTLAVLDVACGHGLYGFTVAAACPQATVRSVDWDNVLPETARHAEKLGVRDRTELVAGDMFEVPLGGPYDLCLITNVLHHFSAERATEMLRRLAEVTRPGGRIGVVAIPANEEDPAEDPVPHLFSAVMLAWTKEGESHTLVDYRKMFADSGLSEPQVYASDQGGPLRLLLANKPAGA
jgi:2-polyprenyl-3-methyl-5-hydroxy-6-metoxy-1,4-benzoquinol methylase